MRNHSSHLRRKFAGFSYSRVLVVERRQGEWGKISREIDASEKLGLGSAIRGPCGDWTRKIPSLEAAQN